MRRRIGVLAAVTGLVTLVSPVPPAQAVPHDVCVGNGILALTTPFAYPLVGQTDGSTAAPFQVTASPRSANFEFHLSTGTCVPTLTNISAIGTVHGWCGLAAGSGVTSSGDRFNVVAVGAFLTLVLTGGATGVVDTTPDFLAGEDCTTGADRFLARGMVVRASCSAVDVTTPVASVTIPPTAVHVVPGVLSAESHGSFHADAEACL